MARYIDADKIPYTMLYKENRMGRTGIEKRGVWKDTIDAMPTADVQEVRRGKWIDNGKWSENFPHHQYTCSVCGRVFLKIEMEYNYCPLCGSLMEDHDGEE